MNTDLIEKHDMLPYGCSVLCAVSGGKDSMYLLSMFIDMSVQRGFSVSCAHFNHKLRGAESDRDEAFVADYCSKNGITLYKGSADVQKHAKLNGLGIEEAARILRYEFLEKAAIEAGADRIATAHNADDNAETMLLNLARGSGLKGLCGIPPVRGKLIRPILLTGRAEIEEYLRAKNIPSINDSSNDSDEYARNRVRHQVVPVMKGMNPRFAENISRAAGLMREDEDFLSGMAESFMEENYADKSIPVKAFNTLPRPISARILRMVAGSAVSYVHTEAIRRICESADPFAKTDIPGMRICREYDRLYFSELSDETIPEQLVLHGESLFLKKAKLLINCSIIEEAPEVYNSLNIFFFKSETICGNISVRSRFEGDSIRVQGRNCTKSLKKLFSEAKMSKRQRNLTPVFFDDKGVIGVYGFGVDERCAARPGDRVLKIEVSDLKSIDLPEEIYD